MENHHLISNVKYVKFYFSNCYSVNMPLWFCKVDAGEGDETVDILWSDK